MKSILIIAILLLLMTQSLFGQLQVFPIQDHADMDTIEGVRYHANPATLHKDIALSSQHFPVGSQGYANVKACIDYLNSLPFLSLSFTLHSVPHHDESVVFSCGDPANLKQDYDLYIDLFTQAPDIGQCQLSSFTGAAAYVAHFINNGWVWGGNVNGQPSDHAVLLLNESFFSDYYADHTQSDLAPSVGLIWHEIGHWLHHGHVDERHSQYHVHDHMANWRGTCGGLTHAEDLRKPRVSAFVRALFDDVYGPAYTDTKYEFSMQDIINVVPQGETPYYKHSHIHHDYVNPRYLHIKANPPTEPSDEYVSCLSDALPEMYISFSDVSNKAIDRKSVV